ncbi:hypothetical protein BSL78_14243 [Apostichopus japonicus]|uniref:SRCR domain-containing protein n=1 Tax=Stichopus japonicus TaxID=307972 RepID=A0A2G8KLN1_STIJA|nr:hypothetical protein BSL78_14243 [Apostichopus japonicus]
MKPTGIFWETIFQCSPTRSDCTSTELSCKCTSSFHTCKFYDPFHSSTFSFKFKVALSPTGDGIRLVGGNETAGRVEVFKLGVWGTVCDDSWDITDANVVCRQLGFREASAALDGAAFGLGSGPTHYDDVACLGHETAISECGSAEAENCEHTEDASVGTCDLGFQGSIPGQITTISGRARVWSEGARMVCRGALDTI